MIRELKTLSLVDILPDNLLADEQIYATAKALDKELQLVAEDCKQVMHLSRIDELPELFNIAKGDMAIIGPRPLLVQYLPYYTETEKHRHDVRPGLSGLAQVNGRNLVKWDQRLAYDIEYVNKITFLGDLKIVLQTVKKVFAREDIAVDTDTVETYLDKERGGDE